MSSRRVLVLGGSGAVGGAVCRALAGRGARLVFTFHQRAEAAAALARALPGSQALRLDLGSPADAEDVLHAAHTALGGLDAVVQCAGVAVTTSAPERQQVADIDEAAWDRMFDVNVRGTFLACRKAAALMRPPGGSGGEVVLLGGASGIKPVPAPVHLSAATGALRGMAQALAKELGPHGVRVNLVAPGLLEEGISRHLSAELRQEYLKHCALRRLGRLPEIANVVAWLALDNTYVTGQTIMVDGAL